LARINLGSPTPFFKVACGAFLHKLLMVDFKKQIACGARINLGSPYPFSESEIELGSP
jgi:hypothetical protein